MHPAAESDFVVIGAGIAGASIAAEISAHASVRLLEMEDHPGYHSTGRSAAIFARTYGNRWVRELTHASRQFFYAPPEDFCAAPLVTPRAVLVIAQTGQGPALETFIAAVAPGDEVERKTVAEAQELCPVLQPEQLAGAVLTRSTADIDVHALHQGYLRRLRVNRGALTTRSPVLAIERRHDRWRIGTSNGAFSAKVIVNAAGAWAADIGRLAGAQDIGLRPLKRTVCLLEEPRGARSSTWPMLVDVTEQFYLKPEAGMLLLSPADETLVAPGDVQPDDWDVAVAVDRLERVTTLKVERIARKWAGLRSFVSDLSPVVGYDAIQPDFFWSAALGGYGIQTAPALSRLAACLALRMPRPDDGTTIQLPAAIAPGRLHGHF